MFIYFASLRILSTLQLHQIAAEARLNDVSCLIFACLFVRSFVRCMETKGYVGTEQIYLQRLAGILYI